MSVPVIKMCLVDIYACPLSSKQWFIAWASQTYLSRELPNWFALVDRSRSTRFSVVRHDEPYGMIVLVMSLIVPYSTELDNEKTETSCTFQGLFKFLDFTS